MTRALRASLWTVLLFVVAVSAYAQGWAVPAKAPEISVPCTGCPNAPAGSLTTGYKQPISTFTGRYLDSSNTSEWFKPFRTARAKFVLPMPALNRIYFRYGDGTIASYRLSTFFSRLESNEKLAYWAPDGQGYRQGNPEVWLKWDTWFNPETGGTNWITNSVDGSLRLTFFDVDDQGFVYVASTLYGWGIVKDDFGTLGRIMQTAVQKYPAAKGDSAPNMIASVKGATKYYAILGRTDMWDTTDRNHPVKLTTTNVPGLVHFAKNAAANRIAIIDNTGTLTINTGDGFATGAAPLFTAPGYSDITSDGTNFFALKYPEGIVAITPSGAGYVQRTTAALDPKFRAATIKYGAGYLALTGPDTGGGWDARVYQVGVDLTASPIVINASFSDPNYPSYFRNYYGIPPGNQYVVPGYINMVDGTVVNQNGRTYLIICAKGIGDVYELSGNVPPPACASMTADAFVPGFSGSQGCNPSISCQLNETVTLTANPSPLSGYDPSCAPHTYTWYLNGVQIASGSPATHTATTSGNLTVAVSNGLQTLTYPANGALQLTVSSSPGSCGPLTSNNLSVSYSGNQGCATPNACKNGEAITFRVDPYQYSFGCAPHQFAWNFGDGGTASGQQVTHSFSSGGLHTVSVIVSNQDQPFGVMKSVSLNTTDNQPGQCPTMTTSNVAIAFQGLSSNCANPAQNCTNGETIQFDATSYAGYDFNCSAHSFIWNFGDGGTATGKSPTHSYSSSGAHSVTVTISNTTQSNFQRQITVNTAAAGACQTITTLSLFIDYHNAVNTCGPLSAAQCLSGEPITFTVGQFGGYDLNCAPHTFDWDFGDGSPHASGKDIVHQYLGAGTYTARCTVNNGTQQVTLQQQVTIGSGSGAGIDIQITPRIRATTGEGVPANTYSFTADVTGAPAGALYVWSFGDGTLQTGLTTTHTYAKAGKYTVTVSVYGSNNQLLKTQSTIIGGLSKRRVAKH